MSKNRKRRKRIIRAYIARAIFATILLIMLILMFCGVLYIRDLFKKDNTDSEKTSEASGTKVEQQEDDKEDSEDLPSDLKQYPGFSVVIDPGHGGNDGGTSDISETLVEKDINWNISEKVMALLKAHGVEVFLTRDGDDYVSLEERAYSANQTSANFFVSLHCNYYEGDSSIDGFEAFYCRNDETSKVYAENIVAAAEATGKIAMRGATENNYYVTRKVTMDGILIEMGFLSNPDESAKLNDDTYQDVLAQAIVDGILATFDGGTSSTPETPDAADENA